MAVATEQPIVAVAAIKRIIAAQAEQTVVAASSENAISADGAIQGLATSAAKYECHSILPVTGNGCLWDLRLSLHLLRYNSRRMRPCIDGSHSSQ